MGSFRPSFFRQFGARSRNRRSNATPRVCATGIELLEERTVLATFAWANLGEDDGLEVFEDGDPEFSEAELVRDILWQAAVKWGQVIDDFNYDNPPNHPDFPEADVVLTLMFEANDPSCAAQASPTDETDNGKPYTGTVLIRRCTDDVDENGVPEPYAGTNWYFDPTPADNSEFLGALVNAFAAQPPAGQRSRRETGLVELRSP